MSSRTCIRRLLPGKPTWRKHKAFIPVFLRSIHHDLKSQPDSDVAISSEPSSLDNTENQTTHKSKKPSQQLTVPPWLAQIIYERRARRSSKHTLFPELSSRSFWSLKNQRTSSNKPVVMKYTSRASTADWLISTLRGDVYGLDLEWNPFVRMDVSLVQICDEENVLLIHTAPMGGRFPGKLKELLEDSKRIKCGVNIQNDASRLASVYGIYPAGLLELGRYASALDSSSWSRLGVRRTIISLEKLAGMYLKQPLQKGMAMTNWANSQLSYLQKLYAANDCYASWKIFQVLDTLRKEEGGNIPTLIDYGDIIKQRNRVEHEKRVKRLIDWGRKTVQHGRQCEEIALEIDELVSLRISGC